MTSESGHYSSSFRICQIVQTASLYIFTGRNGWVSVWIWLKLVLCSHASPESVESFKSFGVTFLSVSLSLISLFLVYTCVCVCVCFVWIFFSHLLLLHRPNDVLTAPVFAVLIVLVVSKSDSALVSPCWMNYRIKLSSFFFSFLNEHFTSWFISCHYCW